MNRATQDLITKLFVNNSYTDKTPEQLIEEGADLGYRFPDGRGLLETAFYINQPWVCDQLLNLGIGKYINDKDVKNIIVDIFPYGRFSNVFSDMEYPTEEEIDLIDTVCKLDKTLVISMFLVEIMDEHKPQIRCADDIDLPVRDGGATITPVLLSLSDDELDKLDEAITAYHDYMASSMPIFISDASKFVTQTITEGRKKQAEQNESFCYPDFF